MSKVFVIGVGMTKFIKPGNPLNPDYPEMAKQAGLRALHDAGISFKKIEQATCSYVYGDSTCGQRAMYELGMTGIPIYNINNNCSSGSSAIHLGYSFVKGGLHDCVISLGFERMAKGSLKFGGENRENPLNPHIDTLKNAGVYDERLPLAPQFFGSAGAEYARRFGVSNEHFGKVAEKNHRHSANNPYSQFKDVYTLEEILGSSHVFGPLTKLQCCPTSDGAGCVILASEKFMKENGLEDQAIEILDMQVATDMPDSFTDLLNCSGFDMTRRAAQALFSKTGVSPKEVQVCELHDCFSANELITYDALGLCDPGKAGEFIDTNNNTYGGRIVVNPSGGLISKGHPLGATGMAQCSELTWQLRNMAGKRQVIGARYALQHNIGLGGAAVVALYKKYNDSVSKRKDQSADPEILELMEKHGMLLSQSVNNEVPRLHASIAKL